MTLTLIKNLQFDNLNLKKIKNWSGHISIILSEHAMSSANFIEIDKVMRGNLKRCSESKEFQNLSSGEGLIVSFPIELMASSLQVIKLKANFNSTQAKLAGAAVAHSKRHSEILLIMDDNTNRAEVLYGFFLKIYQFDHYKSRPEQVTGRLIIMSSEFEELQANFQYFDSLLKGVYFTRDLINEPANTLSTIEFANRLNLLEQYGLIVEILEECDLKKLGMYALLGVGQGSESPSKVVVIRWDGGKIGDKPLLLIGKGVVFDTGGISIKPSSGMEEMTMDMGGAGVVAGVMKTIALRRSSSNVIGLIGLVENMPDGKAQRPGDVVKSMKGDTIEVINTDAEGRLVLCDLLWYAQQYFSPKAIIDLATLTGAVIVALGHENAGIFSNNEEFCEQFLNSANLEGEGAWRLPLSPAYAELLKSRVADLANVGGRAAGSVTAAKFLENFVNEDIPWIHIDIAGVAFSKNATKLSTSGATGWGVASLNRLIYNYYDNQY